MKFLESHELVSAFVKKYINSTRDKSDIVGKIIGALIVGTILLDKPSPNKIHAEVMAGDGKGTFYKDIHSLASEMPGRFGEIFKNIQEDTKLAMKPDGVMVLDEHIIPHSSDEMEGVSWFHSTSENKKILGMSAITLHYYRRDVEYPVDYMFYRRWEELKKWHAEADYAEKNEIGRTLLKKVCSMPGCPKVIVMDSFFMTKENILLLKAPGKSYVSRPKRSWTCTYQHVKYSMSDLFETIPPDEFETVMVTNPKTKKTKKQVVATRNVFIPKIGTHLLVFIDCDRSKEENEEDDPAEAIETGSGRKFRVIVTNEVTWDPATILGYYALRWTIETSYRDMSQDLNLHGCKWRELRGQYCFVGLTFISYLFLTWLKVYGFLIGYGDEIRTVGQSKEAFAHYCQDQFSSWFSEIKGKCETCKIANWLYQHLYSKEGRKIEANGLDCMM